MDIREFNPNDIWITAAFMECDDFECEGFGKVHCVGGFDNGPFGTPFKGPRFWNEYFPS